MEPFDRYPPQFVSVNQDRTAYIRHGNGPPLVLLHGYIGSIWNWEHQIEPLGRRFTLYIPDLLGQGLSDKPRIAYTPSAYIEWLRGFLDALGISRAHLAGNSMGAGLALGLALTHPDRVERLVLISGFPGEVLAQARGRYLKLLSRLGSGWLFGLACRLVGRRGLRTFLEGIIQDRNRVTPAVVERAYRLFKEYGKARPLWSSLTCVGDWDRLYAPHVGTVTAPVLIVWGRDDRFFPLAVGEDLHRSIPGSRFAVIPDAGHLPMWEQPDEVNRLIADFLTTS